MRGSGYAIGEILIFLAIAAIIGFLIGWLVFYRRPDQGTSHLSPVNPNHVRRLEERSQAVDAKLGRIEKRANALLGLLAKTPRPSSEGEVTAARPAPPDPDTVIAPAAVAPPAAKDKAAEAEKPGTSDEGPSEVAETPVTETAAGKGEAAEDVEAAAGDTADQGDAATPEKAAPDEAAAAKDSDGTDDVDDYLSEADDRISKLEETLDKLGEKLADLEND
jgi:hypothetical protein